MTLNSCAGIADFIVLLNSNSRFLNSEEVTSQKLEIRSWSDIVYNDCISINHLAVVLNSGSCILNSGG